MKKLLAGILATSMILSTSALTLAENKSGNGQNMPGDRFNNILVDRAEETEKLQEDFEARKTRIEEKRTEMEAKKVSFATKKEEFKAFRVALLAKREEMRKLKLEGNAIREENESLREDLMAAIEVLKTSGVEITKEQKTALDNAMEQIKDLREMIMETQGQIKDVLKENKDFRKDKAYDKILVAFDKIYAIQMLRNESLAQINNILKSLVQLFATTV